MKKLLFMVCCMLMVVFALAGCGGSEKNQTAKEQAITLNYPQALQEKGFKDPVFLKKKPERVVSLTITPVLTLHELGVNQVGVPKTMLFPLPSDLAQTAKIFSVAMANNIDIESVVATKPDLVFVGYYAKEKYGKILEKAGVPVYYVDAGPTVDYQSVKDLTYILVDAFGKDSEAGKTIKGRFEKLEARMDKIKESHKNSKVMLLQSAPPRHFIQSEDGNLGSMFKMMGFQNVYKNEKSRMVMLDKEQALDYAPDFVVCCGAAPKADDHKKVMEEDFAKNPEYWNHIKAISDGKVLYLPSTYIVNAGSKVVDQMNELMDIIEERKL